MSRDFWLKSRIGVIGSGSWGTVLAHLVSKNVEEVRLWTRDPEQCKQMNSSRKNAKYVPDLLLSEKVTAYSEIERVFESELAAVIWALPSKACRERAREFAPLFRGDETILHATKGVEEGKLKRISEVLAEEIPSRRIGVISGPNLALEIAREEPTSTVVASSFDEVIEAGKALLENPYFKVYGLRDVIGVEWAGALKNVLAIASGSLDRMGFGANSRSMLISRGLAEMVRFGEAMDGKAQTFLGLAGVGDLIATCSSKLSRNYRVGAALAEGKTLSQAVDELGSTAEGVRTVQSVWTFAKEKKIPMPITEAVFHMVEGRMNAQEALDFLMQHPTLEDVV